MKLSLLLLFLQTSARSGFYLTFSLLMLGAEYLHTFVFPDSLDGLVGTKNIHAMMMVFAVIMGYGISPGAASGLSYIRHGEFVVTRAFSRRGIALSVPIVLLGLTLLPLALSFSFAFLKPDLALSIGPKFADADQARQTLAAYQTLLPSSQHASGFTKILIPHGNLLLDLWMFGLGLFLLSIFQTLLLCPYPHFFRFAPFILAAGLLGVLVFLSSQTNAPWNPTTRLFAFSVRHWLPVGLALLAFFLLVQLWAIRRARRFEIA